MRSKKVVQQDLTNFYSESQSVLVIMPVDTPSAEHALSVVKLLGKKFRGRSRIVVATGQPANLVSGSTRAHVLRFTEQDVSYFFLPRKSFAEKLSRQKFDLVIDLNIGFVLFAAYLCSKVDYRYCVGFSKEYADRLYTIQFRNSARKNTEVTYNLLCEFLEKF